MEKRTSAVRAAAASEAAAPQRSKSVPKVGSQGRVRSRRATRELTERYEVGAAVTVQGSQSRPALNGREGVVSGFDAATGRYGVVLSEGGEEVWLRASSLAPAAAPSPDPLQRKARALTAKLRTWEGAFAREQGAPPTEADKLTSQTYRGLAAKLRRPPGSTTVKGK